jgi:ribulose-5-phosphate 4-epimerase/fuculose-1-phosphate aldolase
MLYRRFASIGGIAHTHASFASAWAQARLAIRWLTNDTFAWYPGAGS